LEHGEAAEKAVADLVLIRPPCLFANQRMGRELPPHKDWMKNVFLPRTEKALRRAEKVFERLG
jgi:hypothetical protein